MPDADKFANRFQDAIPTGIGGWLLLLIIKLWVGALVRSLAAITELPHVLGMVNLLYGVAGGYAAYLLSAKNPKGVLQAKIFLLADAAYYVVALANTLLGGEGSAFRKVGFVAASLLYFLYLSGSQRVKATYFPATVRGVESAA